MGKKNKLFLLNVFLLCCCVTVSTLYVFKDKIFYKKTNFGLKYKIIKRNKDNKKIDKNEYRYVFYKIEIRYKWFIVEHKDTFFREMKGGNYVPKVFEIGKSSNFDGGLGELFYFAQPGDVIESEIYASSLISEKKLFHVFKTFNIFNTNLKLKVKIEVVNFLKKEELADLYVKYDKEMKELKKKQNDINIEIVKKKNDVKKNKKIFEDKEEYVLYENKEGDGDPISVGDKIHLLYVFKDFYKNTVSATDSVVFTVEEFHNMFLGLKKNGEYSAFFISKSLFPGDKTIIELSLKIKDVEKKNIDIKNKDGNVEIVNGIKNEVENGGNKEEDKTKNVETPNKNK